jgi:hypothetical protein
LKGNLAYWSISGYEAFIFVRCFGVLRRGGQQLTKTLTRKLRRLIGYLRRIGTDRIKGLRYNAEKPNGAKGKEKAFNVFFGR